MPRLVLPTAVPKSQILNPYEVKITLPVHKIPYAAKLAIFLYFVKTTLNINIMKADLKKPPTWFWVVSIAALLWNLMGVMAYLADAFMTAEALAQLSQEQQNLYEARPAWVTAAFAIAVWGGLLGSIALLLRKAWALTLFVISLIGVLAQNLYQFFLSNTFEVLGSAAMAFPILIISSSILLVVFSKWAKKNAFLG